MALDASVVVLVLLVLVAALVLVAVAVTAFSMFARAEPGSTTRIPCGHRDRGDADWAVGALSYDGPQLVHRAPLGSSLVIRHRWDRVRLDLGYAEHVVAMQDPPALPGDLTLVVQCRYQDAQFQLALTEDHYTALRSWVEAAPPGWNANVA